MTLPEQWIVPALQSFTLAIVLFFVGRWLGSHFPILRRYSIPEPVVGGFLCALAVGVAYFALGIRIEFRLPFRDVLLLYFFAGIGLNADIQTLIKGGRPLVILLALSAVYIVQQNVLGMSVAGLFGMDPRAGLMTGSVSLTGGVGTTLAWAPTFVDRLGIDSAMELGMASNMVGLISACVVGGPIASFLMKRHGVRGDQATPLDVGMAKEAEHARMDYFGVLTAWMWLNVALILGEVFTPLFHRAGLHLPDFVGCLVAGIFLRNTVGLWLLTRGGDGAAARHWREMAPGLGVKSDQCLSMLLTMGASWRAGVHLHRAVAADPDGGGLQHLGGVPLLGPGLRGGGDLGRLRRDCAGIHGDRHRQHDGGDAAARRGASRVHHRAAGVRLLHRCRERARDPDDAALIIRPAALRGRPRGPARPAPAGSPPRRTARRCRAESSGAGKRTVEQRNTAPARWR